MSDDPDQPSFSSLVESFQGQAVPPTETGDAVALPVVRADAASSAPARESGGSRPAAPWLHAGGLLLAVLLAAGGFLFPWIVVDRGSVGQTSYSAIDLPVGNYLGLLWLTGIVLFGVLGWLFRWRWALVLGALSAAVGLATFLGLAVLLDAAPHLLPLWLLPKEARSYVPAIGSGFGPWSAVASCAVLCVWFVAAAIVDRPRPESD